MDATPSRTGTVRDDAALLAAWRAGERDAGELLFDRHFDAIYDFFARRIPGDVGDLVQRTFLGCVEARDRFRGESSFRTFLYAIAKNELYGYFRARKQGSRLDFAVSSLADLSPGPSSVARAKPATAAVIDALRALPLELQLAVELRFWDGLSGPELAVVLDLPEGTVRSRLRRALESLREALARDPRAPELPSPLAAGEAELEAWAASLAHQASFAE